MDREKMTELEWKRSEKHATGYPQLRIHEIGESCCLPLLHYPLLEEAGMAEACFTTRLGGVSRQHLSELNLSFTRGDDPARVEENYRRLSAAIGSRPAYFVSTDQTHTTNVLQVGKKDRGNGVTRPRFWHDIDGLITDETEVVLSAYFADCVPLYFLDPVHRAIGLSHSGWRGTVNRMGRVTIEAMEKAYGSRPEDLLCAIGPSICQDCYEVSEDVALQFMEAFPGHEREILIDKGRGKYQLDLWESNRLLLLEAGIRADHLQVTDICTCCNPGLLFSHRASKGRRGNLGAFIYLKDMTHEND